MYLIFQMIYLEVCYLLFMECMCKIEVLCEVSAEPVEAVQLI